MKLLIKNKIEIIQNTRFLFFFFKHCFFGFSTTAIDWLLFVSVFLARAFVESNMYLLQKPQNNAVARLHSQHMNWWWHSLWTPSNWSRDLNSAPLRNQSTILNVDDGLQPFSHETLWQLCWFHQDSQSEKLEEGLIPETCQALLISHNSLLGAINTFCASQLTAFFWNPLSDNTFGAEWRHFLLDPKGWVFPHLLSFLVDQAHCSMFEFMVVVNHHNCEEVVVLFLWDIPYGITEITSLWLSTDFDHLLSWSGLHTMPHLVTHHFWMTSHLADLFPSSKKCISSLSYFLQILHQPLVSLFPS